MGDRVKERRRNKKWTDRMRGRERNEKTKGDRESNEKKQLDRRRNSVIGERVGTKMRMQKVKQGDKVS